MKSSRELIDRMMAYEAGELRFDEVVALFQELIDSGDAWKLQGHYGRLATTFIERGYCQAPAGEPDPITGCVHEWAGDDTCCYCGARKSL